jgi:multidrug resistance protein MdtO
MWLAFDRLWGSPAVVEMRNVFISNVRLLAQFAREPVSKDMKLAIERSYSLREAVNKNFDSIRNLADGVLLEFGPSRQEDLALRSRILQWQPQLRPLFLTRIALWKYRLQLPGFELPPTVRVAQQEFDEESANLLDRMADRMESKDLLQQGDLQESFTRLERTIGNCRPEPSSAILHELKTFLLLLRKTETLETSLNRSTEFEA